MAFSLNAFNYSEIKTFSKNGFLQMVVEIPAGTNKKIEYDNNLNDFFIDKIDGKGRVINFLPYPGNYGFIPSTRMDKERGGDGDALDILLISESINTGIVLDVIPIALLVLQDSNEIDTKIIAIPVKKSLRIINVKDYSDLSTDYSIIKDVIKLWFVNYKGNNVVKFIKWGDETDAKVEIKKWVL
ncbi:inorganic diphosphatase [Gammaproteobacteria bacterium]|nr:inorganic diphosphatase [Gammaproteobacteria bacterium]MDC3411395.1 inorganic diphosphatase [Gammaproteobacteria bacterium]